MPPHTTKRKITTNLKTKNNQNCQKIKLYRSPTTNELKKKHSSGLVGRTEMSSRSRVDTQQGGSFQTRWVRPWLVDQVVPHSMWINWKEQLGSETDHATQDPSVGK